LLDIQPNKTWLRPVPQTMRAPPSMTVLQQQTPQPPIQASQPLATPTLTIPQAQWTLLSCTTPDNSSFSVPTFTHIFHNLIALLTTLNPRHIQHADQLHTAGRILFLFVMEKSREEGSCDAKSKGWTLWVDHPRSPEFVEGKGTSRQPQRYRRTRRNPPLERT